MEISSSVISKSTPSCYYYSGIGGETQLGKSISGVSQLCVRGGNRFPILKGRAKFRRNRDCGFVEKGHLDYYMGSPVCGERKGMGKENKKGWNEVSMKKKMKLLKGLAKDLSEFSELGFGLQLDCDEGLVVDDGKSKTISEAAEILLAQLKQLRLEEEKPSKEKEEKKKKKSKDEDCDESSSSSSESSDSECDEVVDMKCFREATIIQTIEKTLETSSLNLPTREKSTTNQECCNMILETTLNDNLTIEALNSKPPNSNQLAIMAPPMEKRIEVCTGGKCKKSGAIALMEEFQRVVGDEAVVMGCKCMGKCKTSPNVRVMKGETSNSVLTGVGLEDVVLVVANYLGEEKGFSVAIPALSS